MTAQMQDSFWLDGVRHCLLGASPHPLFEPSSLGLRTWEASTACYRGHTAELALAGDRLVLAALEVNLRRLDWAFFERRRADPKAEPELEPVPLVGGVAPRASDLGIFGLSHRYEGMELALPYSGTVLAAADEVQGDRPMTSVGRLEAWWFERVHELVFADGLLRERHDHSSHMAILRSMDPAFRPIGSPQGGFWLTPEQLRIDVMATLVARYERFPPWF